MERVVSGRDVDDGGDGDDDLVVVSSGSWVCDLSATDDVNDDDDDDDDDDGEGVPSLSLAERLAQRRPSLMAQHTGSAANKVCSGLQLDLGDGSTAATSPHQPRRRQQRRQHQRQRGSREARGTAVVDGGGDTEPDNSSDDDGHGSDSDSLPSTQLAVGTAKHSYNESADDNGFGSREVAVRVNARKKAKVGTTTQAEPSRSNSGNQAQTMTRREQQALAKEQRKREREQRKKQKEHSTAVRKLVRATSKKKDVAAHLATMRCHISSALLKDRARSALRETLSQHDVTIVEEHDGPLAALGRTVWWQRRRDSVDTQQAQVVSTLEDEPHLLVLVSGKELVTLIDKESGLKDFIASIKAAIDPTWKITLVIEGLERFFRAQDSKEHRAFVAHVHGGESGGGRSAKRPSRSARNSAPGTSVTRVIAEHVLVWLQMDAEVYPRLTTSPSETADLLLRMTKAVATSVDKKPLTQFNFYPHVERCVKVDAKTFDGMHELWVKQLKCFPGVSLETAHAIAQRFRSPHALTEALCLQGLEAVSEMVPRGRRQRIGRAIAARMLKFFTATDPDQPLA
ncbi:hypothetical protein PTSG_11542 [Salpingoeca rosetta]|uniref:Uncharacterized protein n=1 Tax=Salpingoeca rosetta (strain ATCC 50818 / BSB-021) TaxID=946362 RepID=F2TVH8_SALR5|nr:uncharacterized protein PTSG_11542 [Salpingoeca rosetta]EGD72074.1 hypothetical protein PTSG_11542 [Salpingoeca rosetta]|eukprot:XP_004998646.1 hypothetical protein PTSG_11542 [Salpingoeca rosetta]